MPTKEEIVLAIGAHIWWKNEFEKAVSDGWHFFNPELAERSHPSDLGIWLAELSPTDQEAGHFAQVQSRFADFHEAAAEVVRMATIGNIDLAEASIRTGLYAQASNALTLALRSWMDSANAGVSNEPRHGLHLLQSPPPQPNREQLGG